MAERVKDDDSRELEKARQASAKAKVQGPQPKPKGWEKPATPAPVVQGPKPRPQVPSSFEPLQAWKKPETEKEKLQSWDFKPRPLTKQDSDTAFTQWVRFKQKEAKAIAPTVQFEKKEEPKPLQLTRPAVNTSVAPISASGTVGAQTQTVRRQPPAPATPDVLRGNYEKPVQPSYNVPTRAEAMGLPQPPNLINGAQEFIDRYPREEVTGGFFGQWANDLGQRQAEHNAQMATLSQEELLGQVKKWYQDSGAVAWGDYRSDRRHALADASDQQLRQRANEAASNLIIPSTTGGFVNPQSAWQLARGALTGSETASAVTDAVANFGSSAMDWFDTFVLEPGALLNTEPMKEGGTSPAMWYGGGHDAALENADDDTPGWIKFIAGAAGAIGGAAEGILPGDQNIVPNLQQRIEQGKTIVEKVRSLPPEQQKQAAVAIPNLISGTDNAQLTYDFITTRKQTVADLRQQAATQKQYGNDLAAAQLGAQANRIENLHIADIKEMYEDPVMEFAVGLLLDPLNFLDAPLGMVGDMVRTGKAAKRMGLGADDVVDLASAYKHIDDAFAQADEFIAQVNTTGNANLRAIKGRPAAETAGKIPFNPFAKTPETLVQARVDQVFNVLSSIIPPNVTASDAKIIMQNLLDNPKALVDGIPAEVFSSPVLVNDYNINGLVKFGNGLVAPKFLSEYYPILKSVRNDLLNMAPLNHAGQLDPGQFIAAVDDIVMDAGRRAYGLNQLPTDIPAGTSKIEVQRVPATPRRRGQPPAPPSQDGMLIYKDSSGNVLGQSNPMTMTAANKQAKELRDAALASGTTTGARAAATVGNIATLRPLLTDMYLGLRPANWVKNAASAYAVMFADNVGSFRPLSEIESYLETKIGPLLGNQRVAQGIAGEGALRTQLGVVEGPHWAEKFFGKDNWYSRLNKNAIQIPYGNKGIKVGNIELPYGEQNFYGRIFQSAFEREFNPHIRGVINQKIIAPLVQQGLDPQLAAQVGGYLYDVARGSSKADWLTAVKRLFADGRVPPSLSALGIPPGALPPNVENSIMSALATGDSAAVDAAMAAELRQQANVIRQAPAQGGVTIPTETAIVNEASDIEDIARMAGEDASEFVSNYVQARRAAYAPLLNDLATTAPTPETADVITAFMGGARKLQEELWRRINDANTLTMQAAQSTLGSTSGIHAQRWQMVQQEIERYLQNFQQFANGFRSRLAAGSIGDDVTTGRNIFDALAGAPDVARPVVDGVLEYGDETYKAVIEGNKAARDKAYLGMWDAARRNPSMLALDTMLAADDRVGDIYRVLAADVEEYKARLRGLGQGDHSAEWAEFAQQRDLAYAEAHNYASSIYDSARAGIVNQAASDVTYKYRNGTYRIVSQTENGWRVQKVGGDAPIETIFAGDGKTPPASVARRWQEAQDEMLAPPPVQTGTVVDDRLPIDESTLEVPQSTLEVPAESIVNTPAPVPINPRQSLFDSAQQAGIVTATKDGKPLNQHLLNSINKHAAEIGIDRKIKRLDDLTPEEIQKAVAYYQGRPSKAKQAEKAAAPAPKTTSTQAKVDLTPEQIQRVDDAMAEFTGALRSIDGAQQILKDISMWPYFAGQKWNPKFLGKKVKGWTDPNNPFEFSYAVVEYDDLITSNTPDGRVNPKYPVELQPRDRTQASSLLQTDQIAQNLNPGELLADTNAIDRGSPIVGSGLVVESGNGRMMALGKSPGYPAYRQALINNADTYRINPETIEGMNRPVLVRIRRSGGDSVDFARQANARTTLSMNAIETGRMLASQLTADDLALLRESGGLNKAASRDFVKRVMDKLPPNERAAYIAPDGTFTTQGKDLLRSTLFSTVFKDDAILRNYVLSTAPDLRNTGLGIEQAVADLALLEKTNPELAIGDELAQAANTLIDLREQGISVQEFASQMSMFDERSPEFMAILQFLDENMRSGKNIGTMLRDYTNRALAHNPNQGAMFTEAVDASKLDLLQSAMKGGQDSLFTMGAGFGFVPPDDWFTGWNQLSARGAQNMGQTAPQMGDAASHAARQLTDAWAAVRRGGGQLPPLNLTPAQQSAAFDAINDAAKMWDDAIAYSQYMGTKAADYAMLNFSDKRNIDTIMGMFMPYSYFWSRSMLNWTKRLARKPSLLNLYYEVERNRATADRMDEIENQGLPARVEGRFPALGDWFTGNPLNMFLPVNSYFANEFVDPELATNAFERAYMHMKQWTPVGGIAIDAGLAALFDAIDPRGEGAQSRLADIGIGDYAPLMRQGTSLWQSQTGQIAPSWLSGDPYAYGTAGRAVATNLDVDPTMRKWALDVGTQLLKGMKPLPEQPAEAEAVWTAAAKQAGWDDWQAKFMAFVLGLPFAKVPQDERTMRAQQQQRRGLGYNGGANPYGSKAAVDAWDEQTGDAATLLAQYPELYPSNTASNPDEIDFGRPGESAAYDMRKGELDALKEQREAEINQYIQSNWGKETDELYNGIEAINAKYKEQEAAIKKQYPSVTDGNFEPTASYYRHHSPEELQAAAETAARFAAQAQVGTAPTYPGDDASREAKAAYAEQKKAYDAAYQNALAAILADPEQLSGYVEGMPTQGAQNPAQRAQEIISDRSYQPEQQQRLGARSKAESAAKQAARQEVFDQFGADIYDLQDQYFTLPEGSQARRDFLVANPQLKAYWDSRRDEKPTTSKGLKGSSTQKEYLAKRAEAESMFGASIWNVVDGYDKDWTQAEKSAYFNEHPELLAFWDFWYGERETSSGRSSVSRPPFIRRGFSNAGDAPPYRFEMPSTGGAGNVGFPDARNLYDPRWAQYQQQSRTRQPGNWQPNRLDRLQNIPLASLKSWA